jgi:DNA-binding SARP family transcriptional activator/tetratricopeptide (TPR) repeat protein
VTGGVRFRILGPLEVEVGGTRLRLRGVRQEKALAALLLAAGRLVTLDELVDAVWAEPPGSARRQIQDLVADLRRALAARGARDGIISTARSGYAAHPTPDELDALRFQELVAAARSAAGPAATAPILRAALDLGRGPTLAGMTSHTLAPAVQRWEQHRLAVLEEWLALELMLGHHHVVAGEAAAQAAEHPLRERPVELLMVALHRAGRGAEALAAYRQFRDRLVAGSGLEPGAALQTLHRAILRGHSTTVRPGPDAAGRGQPATAAAPAVPAQLPLDVRGFTGRVTELARLDAVALHCGPDAPATVVTISGTAGVGKTALAVHWAHLRADRFPDGQLYLNLRGFDPSGPPLGPAEATRALLEALGVTPQRISGDLDDHVELYQRLLTGKRMLIVLDNARDTTQVQALLPPPAGCLALITGRARLPDLDGEAVTRHLNVDLPPAADARDLLARRLGRDGIDGESQAADAIIVACARLPLALAIAAARARQTGFPLAVIAAELRDAGRRLDVLDAGDAASHVRAVFSWSYTALTPPAARLFRLLGLHPGPDVSTAAAASLVGLPPTGADRLLTELVRANLLTEHTPHRYVFHDLLHAYATDLVHNQEPGHTRNTATTRLLDHYVHTAHTAARLLQPLRDPMELPLGQPASGVVVERLTDDRQAMRWLGIERRALLAALRHAADALFDVHTWQLAWSLDSFLTRQGYRHALAATWQTALRAACRLGDPSVQAYAHRALAVAHIEHERYHDADDHAHRALELYTPAGNQVGQGRTHRTLAYLRWRQGNPDRALHHAQQGLALFRAAGYQNGVANELNGVGWYHAELGNFTAALSYCEQALTLLLQLGDDVGAAQTWDSLGYAHHHLGHHVDAVDCYHRALALHRQVGDRHDEADTLTRLGDTHHAADRQDAARDAWRQALAILTDLDHAGAAALPARLSRLEAPAG